MRLEKYGHGSQLMSRMNLPTSFYYMWESDFPDLEFEDEDVFVIYQFRGQKRGEWYHVSFRRDVSNELQGKSILACEILGFDEHCNAQKLPNLMDLKFVRELRREKRKAKRALFYEINLEMKLRAEMRTTLATTPCLASLSLRRESQSASIYIMGLPSKMNEGEVFELCKEIGGVVSIFIQRDKLGLSFGVAIVEFSNAETAVRAVKTLVLLSRAWLHLGHPPLKVGIWRDGCDQPAKMQHPVMTGLSQEEIMV